MKKLLVSLAAAMMVACSPVMADTVLLSSGLPGGSYHDVFGTNLAQQLTRDSYDVELLTSEGSNANIDRLATGKADIAFSQADVWAASGQKQLKNLGTLGQECIFVAAKKGVVGDEDDLEGKRIAIGADGSGSATTWNYLVTLEDDYRSARTEPLGDFEALAAVQSGTVDAFLWVTNPGKYDHDYLEVVRQSQDLHVIDFNDYSINEALPGGGQVYTFLDDILIDDRGINTEIETACTDVLVLARPDADPKLTRSVAKAVMLNASAIRGQ